MNLLDVILQSHLKYCTFVHFKTYSIILMSHFYDKFMNSIHVKNHKIHLTESVFIKKEMKKCLPKPFF